MYCSTTEKSSTISNQQRPNRISKKKYIGEDVRLLFDTIDYTEEKAFDSLEWSFIKKAFEYFSFGDDILRWVEVFSKEISSCVINNGHTSTFFSIQKGVRQGCPLLPYLFIICIELLAISITNDTNLKGMPFSNENLTLTCKICLYADDIVLTVPGEEVNLKRILKLFDLFKVC